MFLVSWAQQVDVVLQGRRTGDEQTFVKFDRALASGGVIGGTATGENKKAIHVMHSDLNRYKNIRRNPVLDKRSFRGTDGSPRLFSVSLVSYDVHFTCFEG